MSIHGLIKDIFSLGLLLKIFLIPSVAGDERNFFVAIPNELCAHILSFIPPTNFPQIRQIDRQFRQTSQAILKRMPYEILRQELWVYPFKNMALIKIMLETNERWTQEDINDLFKHLSRHFKASDDLKRRLPEAFMRFSSKKDADYSIVLATLYEETRQYAIAISILKETFAKFPKSQDVLIKLLKYIVLYGTAQDREAYLIYQYDNAVKVARANIILSSRYSGHTSKPAERDINNYLQVLWKSKYGTWNADHGKMLLSLAYFQSYKPAILPYIIKGQPDNRLKGLAKRGNTKAQYYYGYYGLEEIISMPLKEAHSYLEEAAQKGHAKTEAILGSFYWLEKSPVLNGNFPDKNLALYYLKNAAYKGIQRAQYNLGCAYIELGNPFKATKIFKKLSDQNFIPTIDGLPSFSNRYLWLDQVSASAKYAQAIYLHSCSLDEAGKLKKKKKACL